MRTNLKTWALAGALCLSAASLVAAQEQRRGHDGRQSVETRVSRMRESLNLSDEQAARIESILKDAAAKRDGNRGQGNGERRDGLAQRQEVRRQIDAVLTPEQREKRDQIAGERKGQGGRRGQRRQR
jgi:Spy/CpxP family protein refolding chaperone